MTLDGVSKAVGGKTRIHPTDLTLERGTRNVLLGPTLAGKVLERAGVQGGRCSTTSAPPSTGSRSRARRSPSSRTRTPSR